MVPVLVRLPVKYNLPDDVNVIVPLLVKSPVPFWVILPLENVITPALPTLPLTVSVLLPRDNLLPELTVNEAQEVLLPTVTIPVPVVAITTASPICGIIPPIQVDPLDHVPPVAVLVLVADCTLTAVSSNTKISRNR